MEDLQNKVAELLHLAAETHHQAYLDVDGNDPDWHMFYAPYMVVHGLSVPVSAEELSHSLVRYDREFTSLNLNSAWTAYYAQRLLEDYPTLALKKKGTSHV